MWSRRLTEHDDDQHEPPTRNEAWGFGATIARIENDPAADPAKAWESPPGGSRRTTTASADVVRDFLESRHGRHFADDIASELWKGETLKDAIDAAIARWKGWRIDRNTSRETGIPRGLPYLTGLANHFAIMAKLLY